MSPSLLSVDNFEGTVFLSEDFLATITWLIPVQTRGLIFGGSSDGLGTEAQVKKLMQGNKTG